MNNKNIFRSALVVIYTIISSIYFFRIGGVNNNIISNIVYLFPPFIAILAGYSAYRIYGDQKNLHAKALIFLTLGIIFLFIGELIWFYFLFILKIDPYPSIADVFYICAYPLLFLGLIQELKISDYQLKKITPGAGALITFFSIVFSYTVYYFNVYLAYDSTETLLNNFIALSYGVGDYFLIIPCIFILYTTLIYKEGKLYHSWFSILAGLIFMLLGDVLFAYYHEPYAASVWPYTLIDLTWIASYLLFADGFLSVRLIIFETQQKVKKYA